MTDLERAKELLNKCLRVEVEQNEEYTTRLPQTGKKVKYAHVISPAIEVFWTYEDRHIANGFFGKKLSYVNMADKKFYSNEARELRDCGIIDEIWRKSSIGVCE